MRSGRWRSVASIKKAMHINVFEAVFFSHLQQRIEVRQRGVHLPIGHEAHQMKRFAARLRTIDCLSQYFVLEKRSRFDLVINQRYIHANHATGADVEVSDF